MNEENEEIENQSLEPTDPSTEFPNSENVVDPIEVQQMPLGTQPTEANVDNFSPDVSETTLEAAVENETEVPKTIIDQPVAQTQDAFSQPDQEIEAYVDPQIEATENPSLTNTVPTENVPFESFSQSEQIQPVTSVVEAQITQTPQFNSLPVDVQPPNTVTEEQQPATWSSPVLEEEVKTKFNFVNFFNTHKKILMISGISFLSVILLGFIGFFGYKFFVRTSDLRILNATAKNTIAAKNMSIDFRTGVSGFSIQGKLYVDEEQDIKLEIPNDFFPIEGIYLNDKDTGYLKDSDINYTFDDDGYDKKVGEESYTEFKNLKKYIEEKGLSQLGFDSLNPNKNYLTSENIEFIKKVDNEKIDGQNLYKYNFTPDENFRKKTVDKINESVKKLDAYDGSKIEDADTVLDIWINKKDLKVFRVKGVTKYTYIYNQPDYSNCRFSDYEDCPTKEKKQSFSLEWELNFKYDYKENISLPKNAKIEETVDLLKLNEKAIQEEERYNKVEDNTTNKRLATDVAYALSDYFTDNGVFPDKLELLTPKYIDKIPNLTNNSTFIYKTISSGSDFELRVKVQQVDGYVEQNVENGYYVIRANDL